jgi:hypothetical protein
VAANRGLLVFVGVTGVISASILNSQRMKKYKLE